MPLVYLQKKGCLHSIQSIFLLVFYHLMQNVLDPNCSSVATVTADLEGQRSRHQLLHKTQTYPSLESTKICGVLTLPFYSPVIHHRPPSSPDTSFQKAF